ncbi:hypothetical protein HHI36_024080 [Cryptolaemus montrouzieri]|uniref:Flap endonuclease GEN chromatin organization modifier domain-containing protein n=1 Tax=Cryptolaemus montrouzieri TaxID=559131 RepID=A0ABD2N8Q0_9CUCU
MSDKQISTDGVNTYILKKCIEGKGDVFLKVLNMSLREGIVPQSWKVSTIVPIKKKPGVPSYEIVWSDKDNFFKGLIPDSQPLEIKYMDKFWSTIEPQNLVGNANPKLVEDFRISKIKPKKPTRRKNKKSNQIDELNNSIKNISLSEPAAKKSKKPKKKINSEETTESKIQNKKINMETLDSILKKAIVNNFKNKNTEFTSTPIRKRGETASVDL